VNTSSPRPSANWFEALASNRLLVEMSLWSADLGRLEADALRVEPFTDIFHIDVADGHFSPAMLFFPDLVACVRKSTAKPLHVHLMVADAVLMSQIDQFAEAGADLISVHVENKNAPAALSAIRAAGLRSGLVLQLDTPVSAVEPHLQQADMVTLLGTRIGVKGQGLDAKAESRLRETRSIVSMNGKGRRIIVAADGGIREHTVPGLRAAGAETIVMGSLAFGAQDLGSRIAWVHGLKVA
jgi:ribulose-phosphate 3-epimerase